MKAEALRPGDCIGVFSASSPISATVPVRYERGKHYLEANGFPVIDGMLCGKQDYYRSGSIRDRAEEFNRLLRDDRVKVLMATIGGNNTNAILPYLDYDYLKQHPKLIIGYSDTTALLLAVYTKTGLVTFYGPALASSFGELPPYVDETFDHFARMLSADLTLPYSFPMPDTWTDEYLNWATQDRPKTPQPNRWVCVQPGHCRGRLIGGNLNTMEGFFGTSYMPEIRPGDILLLEDSLKDACTIERSFALLKLAGVFDRVGGIVLGKHEKFDDNGTGRAPWEILQEVLGPDNRLPILAQFDCCHTHPMLTLPLGCEMELDASGKSLYLLESPVC